MEVPPGNPTGRNIASLTQCHQTEVGLDIRSRRLASERMEEVVTDTMKQMMYVSGETGEPSVDTTGIIEDIVRAQVIELVRLYNL